MDKIVVWGEISQIFLPNEESHIQCPLEEGDGVPLHFQRYSKSPGVPLAHPHGVSLASVTWDWTASSNFPFHVN